MPEILIAVVGGIAGLIVLVLIIAALQPSQFRIARSTTITAPPAKVFEWVNDFHRWNDWSPWAKLDPAMTQTFEGPSAGVGAIYSWKGNSKVGEGRMTVLESTSPSLIRIKLEFYRPFAATNTTEFTLVPAGATTTVTWAMMGTNGLIAKVFGLLMNMDTMVGRDFEKGLAAMKAAAEGAAARS